MIQYTIQQLTSHSEGQTFDRKSIKIAAKDLAVTEVAFANADGGTIAIGIADDGKLEGIDEHPQQANELLRVPFDYCQPTVKVEPERLAFLHEDGKADHILLMHVAQSQKVHANQKDEVYYRVGDKSKKLSFDERLQLLYDKGEIIYESKPVFGASLKDVDLQLVKQYTDLIGYSKSPMEYLEENHQMIVKNGEDYKVSNAAILLFGMKPQNFFPRAQVR
ncbi:MAG: putative DNA binding domain-containing protein, partial [Bacteroidales bacterium]|nr:putative DNA binding domain-containing protein [Bacteroidales bacterium]